ncbi:hypothetical protein PT974_05122 [Cladobotryum mycophilum]|uniref:Uncharacterized protein n=1 Tax=Cladobotryum mycophilum TaxID=491253 RepID=A0ABR0SSD1_9HYPO
MANFVDHYWDNRSMAGDDIILIAERGPNYENEDVVASAWVSIAQTYFPSRAPPGWLEYYGIKPQAYRGLEPKNLSDERPDLVIIKVSVNQNNNSRTRRAGANPPEFN